MSPPELEDELDELEELLEELEEELLEDELDELDDELLELELELLEELELLDELELDELELLELPEELDPVPPQAASAAEMRPSAMALPTLKEKKSGLLVFMVSACQINERDFNPQTSCTDSPVRGLLL